MLTVDPSKNPLEIHACLWYNVHNSMSQRILLIGGPTICPILMLIMHG